MPNRMVHQPMFSSRAILPTISSLRLPPGDQRDGANGSNPVPAYYFHPEATGHTLLPPCSVRAGEEPP
jgi:hypothetical protein